MFKPERSIQITLCCAAALFSLAWSAFTEAAEANPCWNCCEPYLFPARVPWLGFDYWFEIGEFLLVFSLGFCVAAVRLWVTAAHDETRAARPTLILK